MIIAETKDEYWHKRSACSPETSELFFAARSISGGRLSYEDARPICGRCPVSAECLDDALKNDHNTDDDGMRGGLTPFERRKILRGRTSLSKRALRPLS